ncbi:L-2-hydroxyglutarate oxidase [[Luteovulum] sphaeroides subsp. megalophilum]|uniref:L-2-hydroxyglutarate oxidase n=1 Tax=Cereibacter sphaeroides TaxID=1063 RepID=UPI000191C3C7|nr:L-2-hydroxyglutarate oxidase [Cereibacter sphaeroides]ACM01661.1 FAD dependent oxidoreductase [Cereibacter sphaeroides KD131]SNT23554.1 L-2-hydroxyglutarate oxidase [[Luteovulum] sphaeroides subsp. megalophilum]
MTSSDFVITGGGIVGLATALRLQSLHPGARISVLEKEPAVARHQSGRNSGVIHAGVYYAPGSHKARFCARGVSSTRAFCDEHGIPYRICGKLIVATDAAELERMGTLETRARANGIVIERLSGEEARRLEPNIKAVGALLSPTTGIVDYGRVAERMAELFRDRGGEIRLDTEVTGGAESEAGVRLETTAGEISAGKAVFCGGLHADRLARAFGASLDFRIVPFRGEYFAIKNQPEDLVQHLIYPVPDPARPFLGVHLTRKMNGGFTVGPNAVLAMAREGYTNGIISVKDLADSLSYKGFWKLMRRNAGAAAEELSASLVRQLYLRKVHKYCDRIRLQDLAPYRAGVRAQAVGADGRMIDDFVFVRTRHALHVCNAPSPAATSALPIAEHIVDELLA